MSRLRLDLSALRAHFWSALRAHFWSALRAHFFFIIAMLFPVYGINYSQQLLAMESAQETPTPPAIDRMCERARVLSCSSEPIDQEVALNILEQVTHRLSNDREKLHELTPLARQILARSQSVAREDPVFCQRTSLTRIRIQLNIDQPGWQEMIHRLIDREAMTNDSTP